MRKGKNKKLAIIIALALVLSQFLGMVGTNIVLAEGSQDYSNIVPDKIIVKYKNGRGEILEENIQNRYTASIETVYDLGIKKIELSPGEDVFQVIEELKQDPNVEYAEPVYIRNKLGDIGGITEKKQTVIQSVYDPNDYFYTEGYQWGVYASNIDSAWQKVSLEDRQSITIAVIDTGVDLDHPDLEDSIVQGYDFVDEDQVPDDTDGHGTHVAGIAAAIVDNNEGIAGVAGGVKIMPLRVIGPEGATTEDVADAIKWAADNGADVINLSLGGPQGSDYELDAIEYAISKGVVIVAAAGNESNHWIGGGPGDIYGEEENYTNDVCYPAAYPGVIGVGAVDWYQDTGFIIADFSNIGPEIDVVAPGVDIISTYPSGEYDWMSGTSQATPFVSGLAGLILAANNDLTPEQVRDVLVETSTDLGDSGFDDYFGYGLINGEKAFTMPRLDMELLYDENQDTSQGTINIFTNDYNGTVISDVYGQAVLHAAVLNLVNLNYTTDENIDGTVIDIVYGQGSVDVTFSEVGYYFIYADENGSEDWVCSEYKFITVKPEKPVSNLPTGTYTGTQTVELSTETIDAQIFYTLDGSTPTTSSTLYQGPISISSTTTLKAISYKNGIESSIVEFNYIIEASQDDSGTVIDDGTDDEPSGGSSGGFSGGSSGVSSDESDDEIKIEIDEDSEGKVTAVIEVPSAQVEDQIEETEEDNVVIDIEIVEAVEKYEIKLPAIIFNEAEENNKTLLIRTNDTDFAIEPGTLEVNNQDDIIKIVKTEFDSEEILDVVEKKPASANDLSKVFDFELFVGDEKVEIFNKPINLTIMFDKTKVNDINKLGVYYYNEAKQEWEYVGGNVTDESVITFKAEHFSKYTVMEYNKTFDDIQNHWAKYDIEVMAAKHIAKGVSYNSFAPDSNITRAEFAALLTRALSIKDSDESGFADVEEDAWYKTAIDKAYGANIVNGINQNLFNPNGSITREEMASMIVRAYSYAKGINLDDIVITAEVKFTDEGTVSKWARRNVRLVETLRLLDGNPDGTFRPKDNTTRAEAIVAIKKLLEKITK